MAQSAHKHTYTNITPFVDDLVPEHVRQYDDIINFAKAFASYVQNENKSAYYLNKLTEQRNIDDIDSQFLTKLQQEIGAPIPRQFAADPRLFYKQIVSFYRARGTTDSIKSFFKLLFDDEVEIYFPKDDMLIPSDGRWSDQSNEVVSNPDGFLANNTYTITSATNTIQGKDDNDLWLEYDNPIIYVNGSRVYNWTSTTYYRDYEAGLDPNTEDPFTQVLAYKLTFDQDLSVGDVVRIFRTGTFTTEDGFLDTTKYIQDSFFYQKFSYVLRTGTNIDTWKSAFNRLVHPSGFIFFGEILLQILLLEDGLGTLSKEDQPGFQFGGLPIPVVILPVDAGFAAVKTKAIGTETEFATLVTKEYAQAVQTNPFGSAEWFDKIKFLYGTPIQEFAEYTFQDVINKRINININSTIETSSIP
jgi:hypothetical protein